VTPRRQRFTSATQADEHGVMKRKSPKAAARRLIPRKRARPLEGVDKNNIESAWNCPGNPALTSPDPGRRDAP
jgi:hypothetical protein